MVIPYRAYVYVKFCQFFVPDDTPVDSFHGTSSELLIFTLLIIFKTAL